MTLEELKGLTQGEVVVLTKVDERITEYHNFRIGDEMIFSKFYDDSIGYVDFLRNSITISHFSYEICNYIERKVKLERENKLNRLGI
jgi:hypothetical protein